MIAFSSLYSHIALASLHTVVAFSGGTVTNTLLRQVSPQLSHMSLLLQSWTPPQLRSRRGESVTGREDSVEPGPRRTRRSAAPTPKKSSSVAIKKEKDPGVSLPTRSRGRSHISTQVDTEADSMATGASIGGSRKSVGPKRATVAHRLETTLTEKVYTTPSGRQSRSRKLSQLSPATSAE